MNNDSRIALTDRLFYPCWLMVCQLRSGQTIDNGKALYRKACQWLDDASEALTKAGFSNSNREHMIYTLCALMDESVLNRNMQTKDSGYQAWLENPLQAKYFNTLTAGENLWERIRQALNEPAADPAVLTCFYRALQLGFRGCYRQQDDERREDVVKNLACRIPPSVLTQETPPVTPVRWRRFRHVSYWLSWGAGIIALAALWLLLSSSLERMVQHITGLH